MNDKKISEFARIATLIMLIFSLIFLVSGVTYALFVQFFRGTTENFIEAGTISFAYNEDISSSNQILLEDAFPIPDSKGVFLYGKNQYFDFSVSSKSTIADLYYEVVVQKQLESTLDDSFVKVYLTMINGTIENASSLVMDGTRVKTYSELVDSNISSGKVAYTGIVKEGFSEYHQDFRLRIWISDEVDSGSILPDKLFSVRVRVNAIEK